MPRSAKTSPKSKYSRYWVWPALVILTFAVYGQVLTFDFVSYDDDDFVTQNSHVQTGLNWHSVAWSFSSKSAEQTANWIPLTWLSLMLNVELFGRDASVFHLTNVVLHTMCVLLLVAALTEMTQSFWPSAFVGAVFAIHPLHVESVAWIAERKDVLSVLFGVLSIFCYVKFVRIRQRSWFVLTLVTFAMSLMSKQTLVTLPFVLLLIDVWPLRRHSVQNTNGGDSWIQLVREKIPFLLVTVLFCAIAVWSQRAGGAVKSLETIPLETRCLNAVVVYAAYLWKTILPIDLAVFYPYPKHSLLVEASIALFVLGVLTTIAVKFRRQHPCLIVGWLWYLGTLFPVIGIVQIGEQQMADRYMYFPMIGLLVAVAWLAPALSAENWWKRAILPGCAASIIAVLAMAAHQQTSYWKDSRTLYTHAIQVMPSYPMHANLGYEYYVRRRYADAIGHYLKAIRIKPDSAKAHADLATALLYRGQTALAIEHYRQAIHFDSEYAVAHSNLAFAYATSGQLELAAKHYRRAIDINPKRGEVFRDLAITIMRQQSQNSAIDPDSRQAVIDLFRRATVLDPLDRQAHMQLARLYLSTEQRQLAIQHSQWITLIEPNAADAQELLRKARAK